MWCVLENKVPIWDILEKKTKHGLGDCYLCKNEDENVLLLFSLLFIVGYVSYSSHVQVGFGLYDCAYLIPLSSSSWLWGGPNGERLCPHYDP